MEQVKAILTDRNTYIGLAAGFIFGTLHHYFGL